MFLPPNFGRGEEEEEQHQIKFCDIVFFFLIPFSYKTNSGFLILKGNCKQKFFEKYNSSQPNQTERTQQKSLL